MLQAFVITKDTILDAIEEEPIGLKNHFDIEDFGLSTGQAIVQSGEKQVARGCAVCAVGAVLRTIGAPGRLSRNALTGQGLSSCSATNTAVEGNYLQALSIVYEALAEKNPDITVAEIREHLTTWAERTIPNDYTLKFEVLNVAD